MPELLDGLNPEQRQACRILDGPLLILAGAGSGKTRTVTHRVAEIIAQGRAQPNQILAVTFTNKAAGEMRQRLQTLIGPDAEAVWCMTFHALCVRILRRSGQALGLATNFAIADSDDQRKIMREILTERVGDGEKVDPSEVRTMLGGISRAKNALQTISQLRSSDQSWQRELAVIWKAYQQALLAAGSVDFDDLLLLAVKALETDHGRAEWARRFTYLHVDEYQDSNAVQTMLLRQLGAASRNICVVGDDDQSVYKWRGAEVEHILHFSRDWPEAKTLKLERNYRSSANIIEAANAVIAENTVRADKQLVPVHEAGSPVRVIECQSGWDEADWVGDEIVRLRRAGANLERVAIIYRTNAQSRVFEERLNTRQIDYHIVGGLEFYRRAEVKTARSYLSLLMNANDRLAFERVIAQPRRGVGQAALASVNRASATSQRSLLQIAVDADQLATISTKARAELIAFGQLYQTLRNRPQSTALVEITRQLLNDSGLLGMYRQQDDEEALANLSELENLIARFTGPWSQALQEFLEHSALVEAGRGREAPGVSLMTMHATKGLEFEYVFLVGAEEEYFLKPESTNSDIEEARRLFYVGMTRAERALAISFATRRMRWGDESLATPARFLQALPDSVERLVYQGPARSERRSGRGWDERQQRSRRFSAEGRNGKQYIAPPTRSHGARTSASPRPQPGNLTPRHVQSGQVPQGLRPGAQIEHTKFGTGVVVALNGNKATIAFKDRSRMLLADSAPIVVIS